jgi:hypothetical protein
MHYISNLFDEVLYMFRTRPLSIISSISTLYTQLLFVMVVLLAVWQHTANRTSMTYNFACIQCWDTLDDAQWTCPKHVEYFIK